MRTILTSRKATVTLISFLLAAALAVSAFAQDASQSATPNKTRAVGAVTAMSGTSITLKTDAGPDLTVTVQPTTKLLRMEPGQTDLKAAPAIQLSEVQVGDRLLVAGIPSHDGKSITATTAVLMKKADVAEKQQRDREDWQRNGIAGVVKSVDTAGGTITVSTGTLAANVITVRVSKDTTIRRYAPNSIKFDDAKPGTIEQIKEGDQLRARGTKSADGKELNAAEIVSGTFRSIPATFLSADAASNTVTVTDLVSRRPVTLKIGPDSQMHQLPTMFAQRIAMRLKGGAAGPSGATNGRPNSAPPAHGEDGQGQGGAGGSAQRAGGSADFQQMLNRMPSVNVSDLQKGSALMIVATEGTADSPSEVIILLSGVEPILTAASPRDASTILSPWNLSGGGNAGTGDGP